MRNKTISFLFILGTVICLPDKSGAQQRTIDSLNNVLRLSLPDTNYVKSLFSKGSAFLKINTDSSLQTFEQALSLSEKLNWKYGVAKSIELRGLCKKKMNRTLEAIVDLESALQIYKALGAKNRIAATTGNIGTCYSRLGQYTKAIIYYNLALDLDRKLGLINDIDANLTNLGVAFYHMGNYPKALSYYFEAMRNEEQTGNKISKAETLLSIGNVFLAQKEFGKALLYFIEGYEILKKEDEQDAMAVALSEIAITYNSMNKMDSAMIYYTMALNLSIKTNDKDLVALNYNNLGIAFAYKQQFDSALFYLFKGREIALAIGDAYVVSNSDGGIGEIYRRIGKYSLSEKHLTDALKFAYGAHDYDGIMSFEAQFSSLDSCRNNLKGALEHYKKYVIARDSVSNSENTKKQTQIEMQYEFDKKTTADSIRNYELKRRDEIKHEQEVQQQKIYSYGGAIGFLLMLCVAIVSGRAFRNKQKANEIISHQKMMVEEKQKEILDSIHYAKRIQKSLMPTEKYISKNIDRLKN